jgi:hypothetical protein
MAGFLLVMPFGALIARYAKVTGSSKAFRLHRLLQFGLGSCLPIHHSLTHLCTAGACIAGGTLAYFFLDNHHHHHHDSGIAHKVRVFRAYAPGIVVMPQRLGGRCRPRAAVRRAVRYWEIGPPYARREPHTRAKRVVGGPGRRDRLARLCRSVARPRLSWPQHARVVRAAIREFLFNRRRRS